MLSFKRNENITFLFLLYLLKRDFSFHSFLFIICIFYFWEVYKDDEEKQVDRRNSFCFVLYYFQCCIQFYVLKKNVRKGAEKVGLLLILYSLTDHFYGNFYFYVLFSAKNMYTVSHFIFARFLSIVSLFFYFLWEMNERAGEQK